MRWAQLLVSFFKLWCFHFSINVHSIHINNKKSLNKMEVYFSHVKRRLKFGNPSLAWKLFWYHHQGPRLLSSCHYVLGLWLPTHSPKWLSRLHPSYLHFSQQKRRWRGKGTCHQPQGKVGNVHFSGRQQCAQTKAGVLFLKEENGYWEVSTHRGGRC